MNSNKDNRTHPIWEFYDSFRTARYRLKIYESQIKFYKSLDLTLVIILAVITPTSALTVFFIEDNLGEFVWKSLLSLASIIAVVKPLLHIERKINNLGKLFDICSDNYNEFDNLRIKITEEGDYSEEHMKEFKNIRTEFSKIFRNIPLNSISKKTKKKFYHEVLIEHPTSNFFLPFN